MPTPRRRAALALALALAACAHDGAYPSLAPRPAEGRSWAEPPAPPPAPVRPDPALDAQIGEARGAVQSAADSFAVADARATPLVARAKGAPAGEERWVAAEAAVADVDAARAAVGQAAGTLEDLAAARAQTLAPDYPPLEAARDDAAARLAAEDARLRTLSAALPAR